MKWNLSFKQLIQKVMGKKALERKNWVVSITVMHEPLFSDFPLLASPSPNFSYFYPRLFFFFFQTVATTSWISFGYCWLPDFWLLLTSWLASLYVKTLKSPSSISPNLPTAISSQEHGEEEELHVSPPGTTRPVCTPAVKKPPFPI